MCQDEAWQHKELSDENLMSRHGRLPSGLLRASSVVSLLPDNSQKRSYLHKGLHLEARMCCSLKTRYMDSPCSALQPPPAGENLTQHRHSHHHSHCFLSMHPKSPHLKKKKSHLSNIYACSPLALALSTFIMLSQHRCHPFCVLPSNL